MQSTTDLIHSQEEHPERGTHFNRTKRPKSISNISKQFKSKALAKRAVENEPKEISFEEMAQIVYKYLKEKKRS